MLNKCCPTCRAPESLVSWLSSDLVFPTPAYKSRNGVRLTPNTLFKLLNSLIERKRHTKKEMQSTKEKLSNMASAAKEHVDIYKAKIDEKAEKAMVRTEEEKVIAHERSKAKEAKAKMELHEAKARHAAEKLRTKQSHHYGHHEPPLVGAHQPPLVGTQYQGHQPVGAVPMPGATYPTYPLGGNLPRNKHI